MKHEEYEINHQTYTSAIEEVKAFVKANGYSLSENELMDKVGFDSKKPEIGKTNRFTFDLYETVHDHLVYVEKEHLHVQIYARENSFELNMYIF